MALAALVNCERANAKSQSGCGVCPSCKLIVSQAHPDLILVEPRPDVIKIEQIRELNWQLRLKNYHSSYKVAIINQADQLQLEAQHALLKTLEEPHASKLIILASAWPAKLLKTVRSRARQIKFLPLTAPALSVRLQITGLSAEFADKVASEAMGLPALALRLAQDQQTLKEWQTTRMQLTKLIELSLAERFLYVKDLVAAAKETTGIFDQHLAIWSDLWRQRLINYTDQLDARQAKTALQALNKTNFLLHFSNTKDSLALEALMVTIPNSAPASRQR